jgi:soluble lytic murein transglycosylase
MAKAIFSMGVTVAAALLLGAAFPRSDVPEGAGGEVAELRQQVAILSAALAAARAELRLLPTRGEFEALERRLGGTEADPDLQRAVELGIVERFGRAKTGLTPEAERRAAAAIVREAREAGLDPLLVAAVIEVESTFRNFAVSPVGAVGLMQVMPATGTWFGEKIGTPTPLREQLFDPERNIRLGVHYLADLERQFGRTDLALLAYNAGPSRARAIARGPRSDLERWLASYAHKVLAVERRLREQVASR